MNVASVPTFVVVGDRFVLPNLPAIVANTTYPDCRTSEWYEIHNPCRLFRWVTVGRSSGSIERAAAPANEHMDERAGRAIVPGREQMDRRVNQAAVATVQQVDERGNQAAIASGQPVDARGIRAHASPHLAGTGGLATVGILQDFSNGVGWTIRPQGRPGSRPRLAPARRTEGLIPKGSLDLFGTHDPLCRR